MKKDNKLDKLRDIIRRKNLIWYTKNYDNLGEASITEAILNYGDWEDVQQLIEVMGIKQTREIFSENTSGPRTNYRPEVRDYFNLYFNKHAR